MVHFSPYQTYIAKSRYARWVDDLKRRENWPESVDRYVSFFKSRIPESVREQYAAEIREAILNLEVMPSMRALMTAGKALEKDNAAGYNCSYVAVDDPRAFDEAMYLSMCGVGVGFSVERQYVNKMPAVAENFFPTDTVIKVRDSKIGWAQATKELISLLYSGLIPTWDLSALRPAGARLRTFGGRSSGPEPLDRLFNFLVSTFRKAAGRKLRSIECHDIMCKIAEIVVSGGVRRSAMISLSNLSDDRMRFAKSGEWWRENGQRRLANNSVAYTEEPDTGIFIKEMHALYESKSGERGIYNREGARKHIARFGRRKYQGIEFGLNPCAEILLRPKQFCNLTEVVVRPGDSKADIKRKVRIAAILGTLQSTLTNFRYLRKEWKKNTEEERLLGVSLTGVMDHKLMGKNTQALKDFLDELREYAVQVNKELAELMGIPQSAAVTCNKPSGTVSNLVNSAPGIHDRKRYVLRAVREDRKNPIGAFLKAMGVPHEPDVMAPNDVDVFYFPVEGHVDAEQDRSAIDQLEMYLTYKQHWCEHNASCTVTVKEHEWIDVFAWVKRHFADINGVSFLPHSDHNYVQAPITVITKEKYEELVSKFPKIDWGRLPEFEKEDQTTGSQEPACAGGFCEL